MLLIALLASIAGAVPMKLTHTGRLTDGGGVPLQGGHALTLTLYDASTGGSILWDEIDVPVGFEDGYFDVVMGADAVNNPLDPSVFDGNTVWLGIAVDGGTELPDRLEIRSVPYALLADTSTNVVGGIADVLSVRVNGQTVVDGTGSIDATSIRIDGNTVIDATGAIDVTEVRVGGTTVIDGSGGVQDTLSGLGCTTTQIALFDGTAWTCADYAFTALPGVPTDIADGDADDWSEIANIPADIADGDDVLDATAVESIADAAGFVRDSALAPVATSGDWADVVNVPADIADGDADDWSEIANIPADIADGDADDWSEIASIPADIADGDADEWLEIANRPTGLDDGDDVLDEAAVDAFVANNGYADASSLSVIATTGEWADILNVPAGFADGVDNQLDETVVDLFVANNGYALASALSTLATSGDWGDLLNIPGDIADGDDVLSEGAVDAFVANNGYALSGSLASIATSGDWGDLVNVPGGFLDGVDNDTIYTDADAVLAVATDDAYVRNTGDAMSGGLTVAGGLDVAGATITSVADPISATDAANKTYVDSQISGNATSPFWWGAVSLGNGTYTDKDGVTETISVPGSGNTNCSSGNRVCITHMGSYFRLSILVPGTVNSTRNAPEFGNLMCWPTAPGDNDPGLQAGGAPFINGVERWAVDINGGHDHCNSDNAVTDAAGGTLCMGLETSGLQTGSHTTYGVVCLN